MTRLVVDKMSWRRERERQVVDEFGTCRYWVEERGTRLCSANRDILYRIQDKTGKKSLLTAPNQPAQLLTPNALEGSGISLDHRPAGGMINLVKDQQVIARLHTKGKQLVIDAHDDRNLDTLVAIALALELQTVQFWIYFIPFMIILIVRNTFF